MSTWLHVRAWCLCAERPTLRHPLSHVSERHCCLTCTSAQQPHGALLLRSIHERAWQRIARSASSTMFAWVSHPLPAAAPPPSAARALPAGRARARPWARPPRTSAARCTCARCHCWLVMQRPHAHASPQLRSALQRAIRHLLNVVLPSTLQVYEVAISTMSLTITAWSAQSNMLQAFLRNQQPDIARPGPSAERAWTGPGAPGSSGPP